MSNGMNAGSPGWTIVESANLGAMDTPAQILTKLMAAFWNFGRSRWRWTTNSPAIAGSGGLVKGQASHCACATFNDNLKFLAERVCGVNGIYRQDLNERFLTVPGGVCIDRNWTGNVRTTSQNYAQMKCFMFSTHYWLELNGRHYDACYNNTFTNREQIIWTRTQRDQAAERLSGLNAGDVYKLRKPLPSAQYVVQELRGGAGPNGWPGWLLVSEEQLRAIRR
jgi:hypothetical protein